MQIFVTGFHRAGSHTISKQIAKENDILWIEEHAIGLWGFKRVIALTNGFVYNAKTGNLVFVPEIKKGFVLQCPFLAHKVLDLDLYGKVYWADRNPIDIITSMKNGNFKEDALFIIKQFHDEFPNDPYWKSTHFPYDENIGKYLCLKHGEKFPQLDIPVTDNWMRYYKLVIDVKKHFLETRFKEFTEVVRLENLPVYDSAKHLSGKEPLKDWEFDVVKGTQNINQIRKET